MAPVYCGWGQTSPNLVASKGLPSSLPYVYDAGRGTGFLHRRSPVGGKAYGIPANLCAFASNWTPWIDPRPSGKVRTQGVIWYLERLFPISKVRSRWYLKQMVCEEARTWHWFWSAETERKVFHKPAYYCLATFVILFSRPNMKDRTSIRYSTQ